jgi:hypothetical protein
MPILTESPTYRKQRLSFEVKSQARVSSRPKSVAELASTSPDKTSTNNQSKMSLKASVLSDYRGNQIGSLKLLKFTVPRSLMTKKQQLQLFGKVSVSYRRVAGDL